MLISAQKKKRLGRGEAAKAPTTISERGGKFTTNQKRTKGKPRSKVHFTSSNVLTYSRKPRTIHFVLVELNLPYMRSHVRQAPKLVSRAFQEGIFFSEVPDLTNQRRHGSRMSLLNSTRCLRAEKSKVIWPTGYLRLFLKPLCPTDPCAFSTSASWGPKSYCNTNVSQTGIRARHLKLDLRLFRVGGQLHYFVT